MRRALGVPAPVPFDAAAARALAVQQGLGVVVEREIARSGRGYRIRLVAKQPVAGTEIARAEGVADDRQQVLRETGELVGEIREALGDESNDASQRFALDTLTATSLDVVRHYATAMDALANRVRRGGAELRRGGGDRPRLRAGARRHGGRLEKPRACHGPATRVAP